MQSPIDRMVAATGMAVPLAGQIVSLLIDSGASQVEISAALSIVREVSPLLGASLLADGLGAPELHPPGS